MSATERNVGMWKIPGRTSSLLLGGFSGVVLEGEKGTDKLDLLCLGALAV